MDSIRFPLTAMVFGASSTPKNRHVADVRQTRGESVYGFDKTKNIFANCYFIPGVCDKRCGASWSKET